MFLAATVMLSTTVPTALTLTVMATSARSKFLAGPMTKNKICGRKFQLGMGKRKK